MMRKLWISLSVFLPALVACGGGDQTGAFCAREPRPATCDQACSAGAGCPAGFYCGGAGTCTADCNTTSGPACPSGQVCTSDGHCQASTTCDPATGTGCPTGQSCNASGMCVTSTMDGGPRDGRVGETDNTCASVTLDGTRVPPNVILLVDRSLSMTMNEFGSTGMDRWEVLYDTLMNSTTGLVTRLQSQVRFGLVLYTSVLRGGTCPELIDVLPPALDARDAIDAVYSTNPPGGATPTGESLSLVVTDLQGMTLPPGPTIILLATDGEPNTCASTMDMTGGQAMAIAAARAANTAGFPVYAIGVGTDVSQANLSMISQAGGGGDAYSVNDPASLARDLEAIVGNVVSCTVTLNGMINPATACQGTVTLGGTVIPCNDPNGWVATDETHIELRGTACDQLTAAGGGLTGVFPCDVIIF